MKKYIVSVDYKLDGPNDFCDSLTKESGIQWSVYSNPSNYSQKDFKHEFLRYVAYIKSGWYLFRRRKEETCIISWQQFHGIFFAFFCRLFRVKKQTSLIITTLIYKRKLGIAGKLYEAFMRYSLSNKYVDHIVCFSEKEIDNYCDVFQIARSKFTYLKVAAEPIMGIDYQYEEPKYLFSAGYSHRDFDFLIDAVRDTNYKLVIADDRVEDPNLPNVIIKRGCYGDDMRKLLGKSYIFVNPLKDKTISAGQLMAITAMHLHKPIICTFSEGMRPYIIDGETGYFVEKTREDIHRKLYLLFNDEVLYRQMCDKAFEFGESQFSWARLAKDICIIAKRLNLF